MTNIELEVLSMAKTALRKYNAGEIDWEQRRYEIAKDVSVGLLATYWTNPRCEIQLFVDDEMGENLKDPDSIIASIAVDYTDALIKQLKGGKK